jgi:poly(hydroxyalkanoate) depolymerase family esterase
MRLGEAIARLNGAQRQWESALSVPTEALAPVSREFREIVDFGGNPGNLQMLTYSPKRLRPRAPLVVVLHGCSQTAVDYAVCSGWMKAADRFNFGLLLPQQSRANHRNGCFSWYYRADVSRDKGEALSIRQMVDWWLAEKQADEREVCVTGLSAGAAMANVLLADYPEIFKAGALIAGLPVGSAVNTRQALSAMSRPKSHSAVQWGDYVRAASPYRGRWPAVSIWHGSVDRVVSPANAEANVKQWCNVHGLEDAPCEEVEGSDVVRRLWRDQSGKVVVEKVEVLRFGHGTPIDAFGQSGSIYGKPGAFVMDAGVSSTREIAKFFGVSRERDFFSLEGLRRRLLG